MTTDQEFLKALRIRPDDDIHDPYADAPECASKDAWIADVQESNKSLSRRLDNAHRWLFLACVVSVLAFFVGMAVKR